MHNDFARRQNHYSNLANRLKTIEKNWSIYDQLLRRVLPDAPQWYVAKGGQNNASHHIKVSGPKAPHPGEGFGAGTMSLIHLIDALYDSPEGDIVVMDEPELSLHPSAQRRLASLLVEFSARRQVVIATHSPYLASLESLPAGATIARVYSSGDSNLIGQASLSTIDKLRPLFADRGNARLLGLEMREALFHEHGLILVEGQDDVLGYPKVFAHFGLALPAPFVGWGVGGASNMGSFLALLNDLGLAKVCGLLDGDKQSLAVELQANYPHYHFATLPAPDMVARSHRKETPARDGALDGSGTIQPQYLAACEQLAHAVSDYFAPSAA